MSDWNGTWGGSIFILSRLSDDATSYGLNVQGGTAAAGTPIILWPWAGGQLNELWQIDAAGHIISQLNNQLVIGLGGSVEWFPEGNYLVLCTLDPNDKSQQWVVTSDGMLQNLANGLMINVDGGVATAGGLIITYSVQTGPSARDEWWWLAPNITTGNPTPWFCIESVLYNAGTSYVLIVKGSGGFSGTPIILWPWQGGKANELWYLADGWISSQAWPGWVDAGVIGLGEPLGSGQSGNYVIGQPYLEGAGEQTWTFDSQSTAAQTIVNNHSGFVIDVQGGLAVEGASIITQQAVDRTQSQNWRIVSSTPLTDALQLAPLVFPPFPDDEGKAYDYINQQLGLGTAQNAPLRQQYVNLSATLSNWQSQIVTMTPDGSVSSQDWQHVVDQLTLELTAAQSVQNILVAYQDFHTALFADQGARLNKLISDAEIPASATTAGTGIQIFQAILYTFIASEEEWGTIANVVNALITVGTAAGSQTPMSQGTFQVACSDLWNELDTNFEQAWTASNNMAWVILSDWRKLQLVHTKTLSTGPGGLGWPIDSGNAVTAAVPPYVASCMQMLLPARYQIFESEYQEGVGPGNPLQGTYNISLGDDFWNCYWIAEIDRAASPAPAAALADVFGPSMNNYVNAGDFFTSQNGWNFQFTNSGPA